MSKAHTRQVHTLVEKNCFFWQSLLSCFYNILRIVQCPLFFHPSDHHQLGSLLCCFSYGRGKEGRRRVWFWLQFTLPRAKSMKTVWVLLQYVLRSWCCRSRRKISSFQISLATQQQHASLKSPISTCTTLIWGLMLGSVLLPEWLRGKRGDFIWIIYFKTPVIIHAATYSKNMQHWLQKTMNNTVMPQVHKPYRETSLWSLQSTLRKNLLLLSNSHRLETALLNSCTGQRGMPARVK